MNRLGNNKGVVLITAYIFLSTLVTLMGGFSLSAINELNTARREKDSTIAFWLAEAGLDQVLYKITNDSSYRATPTEVTQSFGNNSYSANASMVGATYTVTSTGTVSTLDLGRSLRQIVTVGSSSWPDAFNYALFGAGGSMQVKEDGTVTGSIFQYGDIQIKENSTVTDLVYATGTITDKPTSEYTEGELPDPMPGMPTLDTTVYFDPQIATAASEGVSGNQIYNGADLTGGDIYVDGNIQFNAGSIITGQGKIVATGNILIKENSTLMDDIEVIAGGTLEIKEDFTSGSDFVFYSPTLVTVKENGTANPSGIIITPGDVQIKEQGIFYGIIYAGGAVQIKENSGIVGSIVAGGSQQEGIQIKEDTYITHDQSYFPSSIPLGLESGGGTPGSITVSGWEEIAYTE